MYIIIYNFFIHKDIIRMPFLAEYTWKWNVYLWFLSTHNLAVIHTHTHTHIHCLPKVWKRPRKVGFWMISHFQAVQILFGEETVSWHHVCHGMASTITRPQPNWANLTVMSVRSVQPVWIIFGQSFRRLGVIYQVNVWINWQLGCPDYAEL